VTDGEKYSTPTFRFRPTSWFRDTVPAATGICRPGHEGKRTVRNRREKEIDTVLVRARRYDDSCEQELPDRQMLEQAKTTDDIRAFRIMNSRPDLPVQQEQESNRQQQT